MQIVIDIPENLYKANINGLNAKEIWDLRVALKNGTPLPRWIPVSERLPELGEEVLTYHEDDEEYQINWVTDDETVEWFYENPIAWMPLPKPYKAESEDKE